MRIRTARQSPKHTAAYEHRLEALILGLHDKDALRRDARFIDLNIRSVLQQYLPCMVCSAACAIGLCFAAAQLIPI